MINWIVGGLIMAATLYVIISAVIKIKKGKNSCGCNGCDYDCRGCGKKQK
jgi:hypothetical protein